MNAAGHSTGVRRLSPSLSMLSQSPSIKDQMVDMAMNASGIRDTARVLHVSPTTVIKELKKRHLTCTK
jgi:transposase-like protein